MSFPCKENLIHFEYLAKAQRQIYPDACDFGIKLGPNFNREEHRAQLEKLMEFYGFMPSQWGGNPKEQGQSGGAKIEIAIPIEKDEGLISTIVFSVTNNWDAIRKIEFVTFDFNRVNVTPNELRDKYKCRVAQAWA